MVTPELLTTFFNGAVLLLGAFGGLLAIRARRAEVTRRDYRQRERELVAARHHLFVLESTIAGLGHEPPARPAVLELDGENDAPPLPPTPRPAAGGQHGGQHSA